MFDNNQAGIGYNPLAGNLRRQQVPQGPAIGMSGMWPGAYMPSGYPQDRQGTSKKKDGTRNVPQGMLDVWAWKHKKMITRFNEAEIKLQNYQKL